MSLLFENVFILRFLILLRFLDSYSGILLNRFQSRILYFKLHTCIIELYLQ